MQILKEELRWSLNLIGSIDCKILFDSVWFENYGGFLEFFFVWYFLGIIKKKKNSVLGIVQWYGG